MLCSGIRGRVAFAKADQSETRKGAGGAWGRHWVNVGWLGFMPLATPTAHPSGGYLIGGWKVGGNWGVGGFRLGTQAPSIHLEGEKKVTTSQGAGSECLRVGFKWSWSQTCSCVCVRGWERVREWELTHFLLWLNHLFCKFRLIQQCAHFSSLETSCLLISQDLTLCSIQQQLKAHMGLKWPQCLSSTAAALTSASPGFTQSAWMSVKQSPLTSAFCFFFNITHAALWDCGNLAGVLWK